MILPDLLEEGLNVVFCGTAAGNESAQRNAYYADRGNGFYSVLCSSGFTSVQLQPRQFEELRKYGIGLTDLAKLTHGTDDSLRDSDYDVLGFREKILRFAPRVVCFNGKESARVYFGLRHTSQVEYGVQSETIDQTILFVAPSTSGQARKYWNEKHWHTLRDMTKEAIESLWEYCKSKNRLVPMPQKWNDLFRILKHKRKKPSGGWEPPPPLILAAWHNTMPIEKLLRFKEQIQWANGQGQLDEVGRFLRSLPEEEWCHFGEI